MLSWKKLLLQSWGLHPYFQQRSSWSKIPFAWGLAEALVLCSEWAISPEVDSKKAEDIIPVDWVVLPRSKDGGLAVVFAGEVKGGTLPLLPVTPADVPGRLAPVGPEPSAGGFQQCCPLLSSMVQEQVTREACGFKHGWVSICILGCTSGNSSLRGGGWLQSYSAPCKFSVVGDVAGISVLPLGKPFVQNSFCVFQRLGEVGQPF